MSNVGTHRGLWSQVLRASLCLSVLNLAPLARAQSNAAPVMITAEAGHRGAAVSVRSNDWYDLTLYVRAEPRENPRWGYSLIVSLESDDGRSVCARTTLPGISGSGESHRYTVALHARRSDPRGHLVINMDEPGHVWLDSISLIPRETFKDRPLGHSQTEPITGPAVSTEAAAASSVTNAANPQRGGGRFSRANRPAFDSEEPNRLRQLGNRDIRVHDPSTIVKSGGEYWIFYTGMRVPSYHSKDLITWERGPSALTNVPSWTINVPGFDGRGFWAPDVIHLNDRYLLYYSASVFGKNTSGIGLATTPTLDPADPDFHWTDRGMVVQSKVSDDFNTIDPAVTLDADGRLWLAFGSFWSGIRMIELDPKTGLRIGPDSPMYYLAHYDSIEAAFIYRHDRHYYLFVNWAYCCRGADSTYEIRVGRSEAITGPYFDRDGKDMLLGGGTKVLSTDGAFIGPGHAGILAEGDRYWFGCHFYDGTTPRGDSKYAIRPMHWDVDGWPVVDSGPATK